MNPLEKNTWSDLLDITGKIQLEDRLKRFMLEPKRIIYVIRGEQGMRC